MGFGLSFESWVKKYESGLVDYVQKNREYLILNTDWYYNMDTAKAINFYLTDEVYKNYVRAYQIKLNNQTHFLYGYMENILEIDSLMNQILLSNNW